MAKIKRFTDFLSFFSEWLGMLPDKYDEKFVNVDEKETSKTKKDEQEQEQEKDTD